jgi:hypothetical protein
MKNAILILLILASQAAAQSRVDFGKAGLAPVNIERNGRYIPYGIGASTDSARGDALETVVAAAVAGDVIHLGPGTFDIGTSQLNMPHDVSMFGAGMLATVIKGSRTSTTDGVIISAGNNGEFAYFTADTRGNRSSKAFGAIDNSTATDKAFTDVFIHHVRFLNQIDAIHFVIGPTGATASQVVSMTVADCHHLGAWDFYASTMFNSGWTITTTLRDIQAVSDGTLYGESVSRPIGVSCSSGTHVVNIQGGSYTVSGGTIDNHGIFATGAGASIYASNVTISTSGTGAYDLYQASSATLSVVGGKGSGTGGTFTTNGTITYGASDRVVTDINNATVGTIDGRKLENEYKRKVVTIPLGGPTDALSTGDGKNIYRVPAVLNGWDIVGVAAHVTTVSSSGTPTFQINNITDAVDVLSTALTIDANEKDSATAATAAVINTSNDSVATAEELRIDCDVAGTSALGASVEITFQEP